MQTVMRHTKLVLRVLVACLALSLPSQSTANTIVDTGTPVITSQWSFNTSQYFAGEFTITDAYLITGVEGYFSNQFSPSLGSVDIAIHADGGNTPGAILFTASTPLAANAPLAWYGVSLNQVLASGTYWASFKPSSSTNGIMPGTAPNPMGEYAQANGAYAWQNLGANYFDYLDVGVRIYGDKVLASVPDSTSTLGLFIGVVLLGFVAQRLWT